MVSYIIIFLQLKAEKAGKKPVPVAGANKRPVKSGKIKADTPPKVEAKPKDVKQRPSGAAWVIPN